MIDVNEISPAELKQLEQGQVYIPSDQGDRFVGGLIGEASFVAILSGTRPFEAAPGLEWDRPLGWIFDDVRFEVDETSSAVMRHGQYPEELGSLVVAGGGLWLFAKTSQTTRQLLCLRNAELGLRESALAFSKWRIARGSKDEPQILVAKG